jgi:putative transposase
MSQYDYKPEYRRHLPHMQPPGTMLFITFRLANSLPKVVLARLRKEAEAREEEILQTAALTNNWRLLYEEQKRQFARWDTLLDRAESGPHWLG